MVETSAARPQTFTCSACGETFECEWSEEEALAEEMAVFGQAIPAGQRAVVCDDCYGPVLAANAEGGA